MTRRKNKGKAIADPPQRKKRKEMPFVDYYSGEYRQPSLYIRDNNESGTMSNRHGRSLVDTSSDEEDVDMSMPQRSSRGETSHVPRAESSQVPRADSSQVPRAATSQVPRPGTSEVPRPGTSQVPREETSGSIGRASAGTPDTGNISIVRRRGAARDCSPPRTGKTKIEFVGDELYADDLAGFFRPLMRKLMNGFYPQWTDVPRKEREEIWERFLENYNLDDHDHDFVYQKFMEQNSVKFRKFLHDMKRDHMRKFNVKDVAELIDKPKPAFMKSDSIWKEYVRHWSSPEQRARSEINVKNRAVREGKSHGYGRKSVAARIVEQKREGKTPSLLNVIINANIKRDDKKNPTGEVHHEGTKKAIDEYCRMHIEARGSEANPEEEPLDYGMWTSTSEVARRLSQGRVLGIGTCKKATSMFVPSKNLGGSNAQLRAELEEYRRNHQLQLEEDRRKHQLELEEDRRKHQLEMEEVRRNHELDGEARTQLQAQVAMLMKAMSTLLPNVPLSTAEVPPPQSVQPDTTQSFPDPTQDQDHVDDHHD